MKVIRNPQNISKLLKGLRSKGKSIGFVPTMGALHLGHLSLINQAKQNNDLAVVSIFVNPAQFGPREDLHRYPRPLKNDLLLCRKQKVDLVFLPSRQDMYPEGFCTSVNVEGLSDLLCGANRPGHFRGVATVVTKLLNIVGPDVLYLGQKDAQQAVILARMIKDLNFPVKVKVLPIVRQKDGLALSSRNVYLNKAQRVEAQVLSKALGLARSLIEHGQSDAGRIIDRIKELINRKKQAEIDYVAIVDLEKLKPLKKIKQDCLICLAVKIGKTRLIDNLVITYG
ncbi:MAG: pantoate--beta-alanine ligase [Candidatus Omnitrophica bacterium CG11_big_fil_rev_8_21_14_0_20_43_6]|nr:MAG: pantoate--beta-alanine ligase [Candidatus Omnitrophica bacterium CG11_big_fil_rev_8_21_14_0_20_43_6]